MLIHFCLEVINRGGLIVKRRQSDHFTTRKINADLPGMDCVGIGDLIGQHLSALCGLASHQGRIRQDYATRGVRCGGWGLALAACGCDEIELTEAFPDFVLPMHELRIIGRRSAARQEPCLNHERRPSPLSMT